MEKQVKERKITEPHYMGLRSWRETEGVGDRQNVKSSSGKRKAAEIKAKTDG